ncbi:hypothetical protein [Paenibacillus wynnii]|uniref:hypothetical protein n=1 Tax=Paenibacillus wynnii TaxID=268407 RepID=UPI00068DE3DF|nr:hypothetical protein [Paenibacillus wynnii]
MEKFRFFNSTESDIREYTAADYAEYFGLFLSDGLYTENGNAGLRVVTDAGLNCSIESGYALIRGYMYHNDSLLIKTLAPADTMLDRIDRVALRFDEVAREIKVVIKKGIAASNPVVPALTITATVKELGLAQIHVRKGATTLSVADITDERLTSAGLVSSLISIPAAEMWNVWNSSLASIQSAWDSWFATIQNTVGNRLAVGDTAPANPIAGDVWMHTGV